MPNLKNVEERISKLLNSLTEDCGKIDDLGYGVENFIPDTETSAVFHLCLDLFNAFIAISDGDLDEKEITAINSTSESHFTKKEMLQIIDKAEVQKDEFAQQIPTILRTFVNADNQLAGIGNGELLYSVALYDLFTLSGVYVMAVNNEIANEEYSRLMSYLKSMYRYIKQNLKSDCEELKRPEVSVSSILDTCQITLPKKLNNHKYDNKNDSLAKEENQEPSLEELLAELNAMTGLEEVKYEVSTLINLLRIKALREEMGLKMPPVTMHLVFSGNPGTGKTTVARLLAKIYKEIGVLSKGQLIETDRAGLVGGYVGQTAIKTAEVIQSAIGGILFIDEAYSLTPKDRTNDYGAEAIDTIIKAMEDNRDDLVVIVAGYPELMQQFLGSNPGLRSRFNKFIQFRDYTPEELTQIFISFCDGHGYRASKPALEYVYKFFEDRCKEEDENFANAREVRNLFEFALSRQANRVILVQNPSQNDLTLLTRADVAGESINLGKQQYMAQLVINNINRPKRHGVLVEDSHMFIDELEYSARTAEILTQNGISTVKDILDYIDSEKELGDMAGASEEMVEEIIEGLETIGFINE